MICLNQGPKKVHMSFGWCILFSFFFFFFLVFCHGYIHCIMLDIAFKSVFIHRFSPPVFFFYDLLLVLKMLDYLSCRIFYILDLASCVPVVSFDLFLHPLCQLVISWDLHSVLFTLTIVPMLAIRNLFELAVGPLDVALIVFNAVLATCCNKLSGSFCLIPGIIHVSGKPQFGDYRTSFISGSIVVSGSFQDI